MNVNTNDNDLICFFIKVFFKKRLFEINLNVLPY